MSRKAKRHRNVWGGLDVFFRRLNRLIRKPIFLFVTFWGHSAIICGTFGLYYFEKDTNSKIHSALDTFYWAIATTTTVGYGDVAPVTLEGKIIGILMMIGGSLFLWSYIGLFLGALMSPDMQRIEEEVQEIEKGMIEVEKEMKIEEYNTAELIKEIRALRSELRVRK